MDGSARPFVNLIVEGEPVEQDREREYFTLDAPVSVTRGNSSIIAIPARRAEDLLHVGGRPRHPHPAPVARRSTRRPTSPRSRPPRTFTIYEDIEELLKLGKIRGGSLDCAVVIKGDKMISKEPLRFKDEFVRHKILDIIGDVSLLGMPLKAHIVATRPGHAINAELTKALFERLQEQKKGGGRGRALRGRPRRSTSKTLDIRSILDILPHRYPFVMIDRVVEIKGDGRDCRHQERHVQRALLQRAFPGQPGHARGAPARGDGPGGGDPDRPAATTGFRGRRSS